LHLREGERAERGRESNVASRHSTESPRLVGDCRMIAVIKELEGRGSGGGRMATRVDGGRWKEGGREGDEKGNETECVGRKLERDRIRGGRERAGGRERGR
jgi:hypothetical protein